MKIRFNISGQTHDVTVEFLDQIEERAGERSSAGRTGSVSLPMLVSAPTSAAPGAGANAVVAPLAGLIVQVSVQSGAEVKAGQVVVVLEAMKMMTNINTPRDGKVKAVCVAKGKSVKQGEILIELE